MPGAFVQNDTEASLNAAFATSDLRVICRAVDACILSCSNVTEFSQAAEVDRTTLYRAFRLANGPALDTMTKVLQALGFELIVRVRDEAAKLRSESERLDKSSGFNSESRRATKAAARRFNIAFASRNVNLLLAAFAESLRLQANVSHFASKTIVSREALYRIFTGPRTPRFSTVLSFLNALGLRFAVRRVAKNRHWAGAVRLND